MILLSLLYVIYAGRRVSIFSLNEDAVGSEDRFIRRIRKAVVKNDFSGNIAFAVVDGNIPLNIFVERNTVFSDLLGK